jgi:hypothetical protein
LRFPRALGLLFERGEQAPLFYPASGYAACRAFRPPARLAMLLAGFLALSPEFTFNLEKSLSFLRGYPL